MTLTEFTQKYLDMRELQKEYFRTRSPQVLQRSKAAERELDRLAEDIINPKTPEPSLF